MSEPILDKLLKKDSFLQKQERRPYGVPANQHIDIYDPRAELRKWNPPDQAETIRRASAPKASELMAEEARKNKINERSKRYQ